nr:hypothetical protein [Tanacetum cinerariifolium]
MSSLFVDTHNVVTILEKSDAAKVKRSDDVTRLQALVDKKKIVILESMEVLNSYYSTIFEPQKDFLNEFSTTMASANQVGDLSTHSTRFISPALTQKVFANMRRVGKGFSGVETPLFEGMLAARQPADEGLAEAQEPSSPPQQPQSSPQAPPHVSAASATISAAKPSIPAAAPTAAETPKAKDKGKGILVETLKPMKKKDQIELDAEYARKLHKEINRDHKEINKDIDWDAAMDHVNQKSKNPQYI